MKYSVLFWLSVLWLNMDVSLSQNGCQTPPPLADGDIKHTMKSQYNHNERVEYVCQMFHTMEGDRHRTCIHGEWTGQQRCLKPCQVNDIDMMQHNIAFRYYNYGKLYANHNDIIEFRCTEGTAVGSLRQRCNDGVILLPSCQ